MRLSLAFLLLAPVSAFLAAPRVSGDGVALFSYRDGYDGVEGRDAYRPNQSWFNRLGGSSAYGSSAYDSSYGRYRNQNGMTGYGDNRQVLYRPNDWYGRDRFQPMSLDANGSQSAQLVHSSMVRTPHDDVYRRNGNSYGTMYNQGTGLAYNRNVYGRNGYYQNGYNGNGYYQNGYNRNGYYQNGYNRNGYNQGYGYNRNGYNQGYGYNRNYNRGFGVGVRAPVSSLSLYNQDGRYYQGVRNGYGYDGVGVGVRAPGVSYPLMRQDYSMYPQAHRENEYTRGVWDDIRAPGYRPRTRMEREVERRVNPLALSTRDPYMASDYRTASYRRALPGVRTGSGYYGNSNAELADRVRYLEQMFYGVPKSGSVSVRVERMEVEVLGRVQTGNLAARLNVLENYI